MLSRLSPLLLLAAGASVAPQWSSAGAPGTPARDTGDLVRYTLEEDETLPALAEEHFLRPEDWRKARALNGAAADTPGASLRLDTGWLKRTPLTAEVVAFRGDAVATVAGAEVAVRRGLILSEGDRLRTGAEGFATLRLPDGSLLSLPTNSAVRFDRLRRYSLNGAVDRRIHVETGAADSRVMPLRDETSRFEVRTGLGVAAVRGTRFRVDFTPGRMLAEVSEGKVGVRGRDGPETLLGKGFGLVVGPAGAGQPVRLPSAPTILSLPAFRASPGAILSVRALEGLSYRAILATDPDFLDQVAEVRSADGRLRFEGLGAGSYHVAVQAVLPSGLAGPATVARFDWGGPSGIAAADPPPPTAPDPSAPPVGDPSPAASEGASGIAALGEAARTAEAFAAAAADAEGDIDEDGVGMATDELELLAGPWSGLPLRLPSSAGRWGGGSPAPSSAFGASFGGGAGGGWSLVPQSPGPFAPPTDLIPGILPAPPEAPALPPSAPTDQRPGPDAPPGPPPASPTPEPATWMQLLAGFALLGTALRRASGPARRREQRS